MGEQVPYDKEFYGSQKTLEREEVAYQAHKAEWDEKYRGEYIALHRGEVVAHDKEKSAVMRSLIEMQRESGRFRAYLVQVGAPLITVRGPSRRFRPRR